ncbi:hypothetical protein HAX54_040878 [Datura stramonium]|uniref:Apple domain-containing protein n=1 Tax=Datura stramonium TaxID=4076 RepID=A0ABS8SKN5_DATST|nr:hypothetical protein [Datura stramonium]
MASYNFGLGLQQSRFSSMWMLRQLSPTIVKLGRRQTGQKNARICALKLLCMAYSNAEIHNEASGCILWFEDLLDIRQVPEGGQDIYIRMAASEAESKLLLLLFLFVGMDTVDSLEKSDEKKRKKEGGNFRTQKESGNYNMDYNGSCAEEFEIPLFDLSTIMKATNNFSINRKIGEGGFGPVYKVILVQHLKWCDQSVLVYYVSSSVLTIVQRGILDLKMKALLRESFYLSLLLCLYSIHHSCGATDTITTTHFLKDDAATITSPGGIFEMGFFSPGNSENRYVGMWYKNISVRTVVWATTEKLLEQWIRNLESNQARTSCPS